MKDVLSGFKHITHAWRVVVGLMLFVLAVPMAHAFGSPSKFLVIDNSDSSSSILDPSFTVNGTWAFLTAGDAPLKASTYGYDLRTRAGAVGSTAAAYWNIGLYPIATGSYGIDVFIPATGVINSVATYSLERDANCDAAAWATVTTFPTFNQNSTANEGQFRRLGTVTLNVGECYRVKLSGASTDTDLLYADAVRIERLFESAATIPDMPFVVTSIATGTTAITSSSSAAPTIVTTRTITCPAAGNVLVTGSGESTGVSNLAGTAFIGLAYSISLNSTATDNTNVVQSSALAVYNGDSNRDFLNVQRVDSCVAGQTLTYRLTAYRAQLPATSTGSFVWNGRLVAQYSQ